MDLLLLSALPHIMLTGNSDSSFSFFFFFSGLYLKKIKFQKSWFSLQNTDLINAG